jgi:hypothetical protein
MPPAERTLLARMRDDVGDRLLADENGGQQEAVVAGVRLGAEDRDVVEIGRPSEQFLDSAQARHAVADNDQPLPIWAPAHTRASARLLGRCCARKLLRM